MPSGRPLAALFLLWIAGRITMALPACPAGLNLAVNAPLLPLMAGMVVLPILRKRQWRPSLLILPCALASTGVAMHLGHMGVLPSAVVWAGDAAMLLVLVLITVMGGRIMPFFTSRGLGHPPPLKPTPLLDVLTPATLLLAGGLGFAGAPSEVAAGTVVPCDGGCGCGAARALATARCVGSSVAVEPAHRVHLPHGWLLPARRRRRGMGRDATGPSRLHGRMHRHGVHRHDEPCRARPHRTTAPRGCPHPAGASIGGDGGIGARAGTLGRSRGICARGGRVRRPLDDRLCGLVRRPRPNVVTSRAVTGRPARR